MNYNSYLEKKTPSTNTKSFTARLKRQFGVRNVKKRQTLETWLEIQVKVKSHERQQVFRQTLTISFKSTNERLRDARRQRKVSSNLG